MNDITTNKKHITCVEPIVVGLTVIAVCGILFQFISISMGVKEVIMLLLLGWTLVLGHKSRGHFPNTIMAIGFLLVTGIAYFAMNFFGTNIQNAIYLFMKDTLHICEALWIIAVIYYLCKEFSKRLEGIKTKEANFIQKLCKGWIVYLVITNIIIAIYPVGESCAIIVKNLCLIYIYYKIVRSNSHIEQEDLCQKNLS